MKTTAGIVLAYGLFIIIGGVIGYVKAVSLVSLIMGIVFGSALLLSAFAISKNKSGAQYFALVITLILDGFFTFRFAKTLHFLPAGLMSLLSLVVLIVLVLKIRRNARRSTS